MARVLSGVALAAVFLASIWFLRPVALLVLALAVAALAFAEYARIARAIGADTAGWWRRCCDAAGRAPCVPFHVDAIRSWRSCWP